MKKIGLLMALCCLFAFACEMQEGGEDVTDRFMAAPEQGVAAGLDDVGGVGEGAPAKPVIHDQHVYDEQLNWLRESGADNFEKIDQFIGEFSRVVVPEIKEDFIEMNVPFETKQAAFVGWKKNSEGIVECDFRGGKEDLFGIVIWYGDQDAMVIGIDWYYNGKLFGPSKSDYELTGYSLEEQARVRMLAVICLRQVTEYVKVRDANDQRSMIVRLNENF